MGPIILTRLSIGFPLGDEPYGHPLVGDPLGVPGVEEGREAMKGNLRMGRRGERQDEGGDFFP